MLILTKFQLISLVSILMSIIAMTQDVFSNETNLIKIDSIASKDCDCPPERDDWFTILAEESKSSSGEIEYKVTQILELPRRYHCYSFYQMTSEGGGRATIPQPFRFHRDVKSYIVSSISNQIESVYLYTSLNDTTPCTISQKPVLIKKCECFPNKDTWLNISIERGKGKDKYSCIIEVMLDIPIEAHCYNSSELIVDGQSRTIRSHKEYYYPKPIEIRKPLNGKDVKISIVLSHTHLEVEECMITQIIKCDSNNIKYINKEIYK